MGGDYGISIVLGYEDGVDREYNLSLNDVTGNVYQTNRYCDVVSKLYNGSKVVKVISTKVFIKEFNSSLVDEYVKFTKVKISFIDRAIANISEQIAHRIEIVPTNGLLFKNGIGTTTLVAKLYKGKEEVDIAEKYSYVWRRKNSIGAYINIDENSVFKTGKTILVD